VSLTLGVHAHLDLNYENRDFLGLHRDGPFTPISSHVPTATGGLDGTLRAVAISRRIPYRDLSGRRPEPELGPGLITKGTMMRSIKMAGVLFILALALSGIAGIGATTASAAPELLPDSGVITEYTFTATSGPGELTGGPVPIKCKKDLIELKGNKITSTTHFEADVDFEECTAVILGGSFTAISLGDKADAANGGLILTKVLGLLCLFKDGKTAAELEVGVFFELDNPVHIEIPSLGELVTVKGSVIGVFPSTDLNVLKTGPYKLKLTNPNPKECEGKKASLLQEENENGKPVAAQEITTEEITFDKDVKIDG
jgi:hypothetical protein